MVRNPFKPGFGLIPPYLAGREECHREFKRVVENLREGSQPKSILMVGPRGCGKTSLLGACRRVIESAGVKNLRVKRFSSDLPLSQEDLAAALLKRAFRLRRPAEMKLGGERLGVTARWAPSMTASHLFEELIRDCRSAPLLIMVDEGSQESAESFSALFNLSQKINDETGNIVLVLAGTPGTLDLIKASGATFYDRAEKFNIGLLSDDASCEAIEKPLAEIGLSIDADVLKEVVGDSQGFPYFLQVWGEKLVDEARETSAKKIARSHLAQASPRVATAKNGIYESRCEDWADDDLRVLAGVLAVTQEKRSSGVLTKSGLQEAIESVLEDCAREQSESAALAQQIIHTGFLWKPMDDHNLILGLPSFAGYITERAESKA